MAACSGAQRCPTPLIERRTAARCELLYGERTELLAALHLSVKHLGVALQGEDPRALTLVLAPAGDPPVSAAGSFDAPQRDSPPVVALGGYCAMEHPERLAAAAEVERVREPPTEKRVPLARAPVDDRRLTGGRGELLVPLGGVAAGRTRN